MEFTTSSVMSKEIATVMSDESIHHVYFKMKQSYIKYMPVVDKAGDIIGIITDLELNRPIPSKAKVSDYMIASVGQAPADSKLLDVAKRMLELKFAAIVIHDKRQIVGVISPSDLLQVLVPLLAVEKDLITIKSTQVKSNSPVGLIANFFHAQS